MRSIEKAEGSVTLLSIHTVQESVQTYNHESQAKLKLYEVSYRKLYNGFPQQDK